MAPSGPDPSVYDHLRVRTDAEANAVDPGVDPGVYRVVGTGESTVTLLRVGDADGYRVTTGQVVTVERDALDGFEAADNPDGNSPIGAMAVGALESLGWQLRTFGTSLAERPLLSVVALVLFLAGAVGDQFVSGPEWSFTVAVIAGSLGLAAIGSKLL